MRVLTRIQIESSLYLWSKMQKYPWCLYGCPASILNFFFSKSTLKIIKRSSNIQFPLKKYQLNKQILIYFWRDWHVSRIKINKKINFLFFLFPLSLISFFHFFINNQKKPKSKPHRLRSVYKFVFINLHFSFYSLSFSVIKPIFEANFVFFFISQKWLVTFITVYLKLKSYNIHPIPLLQIRVYHCMLLPV